jgi:signal peptidase I
VIAVPGDVVAVQQGQLILNGRPVARQPLAPYELPITANTPCKTVPPAPPVIRQAEGQPVCVFRAFRETLPGGPSYTVLDQLADGAGDDFPATRVPAGRIFLMGDNRDDSLDSRFSQAIGGIGMVPTENLIGRAMVTFWSTEGAAAYWNPVTWFTNLRASRIGNGYSGDAE